MKLCYPVLDCGEFIPITTIDYGLRPTYLSKFVHVHDSKFIIVYGDFRMDFVDIDQIQMQKPELLEIEHLQAGSIESMEPIFKPSYKPLFTYQIPEDQINGTIRV